MNLSAIPADSWIGRIARWPLSRIPASAVVPILQGALRGKKWVVGSSTHGCWLGSYEYAQRRLFEAVVGRDDVVYDIGAHVGFYTLLASILVGPEGHVVAFEPFARNLAYLRRHLELNEVRNVTVREGAVCEREGSIGICEAAASSEIRIDPEGKTEVRALALDSEVFRLGLMPPTVMKIDVEGAEARVLEGGVKTLSERRPRIFLSTHGSEVHLRCCELLVNIGYRLRPINAAKLSEASEIFAEV